MTEPRDMLVARLHAVDEPMRLERIPLPEPGPTDVVVKVAACNIDVKVRKVISAYAEHVPQFPLPQLPAIFGQDSSGIVTQVGEQVAGLAVGDRVYVNPGLSCGGCRACRRGEAPNCAMYTFMGYFSFGLDGQRLFDAYPYGGLGEYLLAPQQNLIRLPDSVSFEQGARFGWIGTAYSALKKARVGPGRTVLIDGISGTLGIGAVLSALALGATRIFGTGRDVGLLADVRALAPHRVEVCAVGEDLRAFVAERNNGGGVDAVISTLGSGAPSATLVASLAALDHGGVFVNVGGVGERFEIDPFELMCRQQSVIGSLWFTNDEAQELADLAGAGLLDLSVLEHDVHPLERVNEALEHGFTARHGGFSNFIVTPDPALLERGGPS